MNAQQEYKMSRQKFSLESISTSLGWAAGGRETVGLQPKITQIQYLGGRKQNSH